MDNTDYVSYETAVKLKECGFNWATHNGCDTELSIGENVNYLIQCLSVMKDGEVLIRMSEFNRPLIFTQRENPDLVALVMPLKLAGE